MEEDNYESISLSDSELSMIDEGEYTNVPTAEIEIDTSPDYSPITEPISFSSTTENYLPPLPSNSIQNRINEAPLMLPIEYISTVRELLLSMVITNEQSSNETSSLLNPTSTFSFTLPTNETETNLQLDDWLFQPLFEIPSAISVENSTNHTILTSNKDTTVGHYDDIIFKDIDQIVNHTRRWSN